jgi:hypothetical protein
MTILDQPSIEFTIMIQPALFDQLSVAETTLRVIDSGE